MNTVTTGRRFTGVWDESASLTTDCHRAIFGFGVQVGHSAQTIIIDRAFVYVIVDLLEITVRATPPGLSVAVLPAIFTADRKDRAAQLGVRNRIA